jgi:phage-related holin
MVTGIIHAHSGWRYLVILIVVLAIAKYLLGWLGKGRWSKLDQTLGLLTPWMFNIQFVLGLVLWIMQERWLSAGNVVAAWEHPVTMLISVAVAQITWGRVKRAAADSAKFRTGAIGFIIAGLLLALGVARITGVL